MTNGELAARVRELERAVASLETKWQGLAWGAGLIATGLVSFAVLFVLGLIR